MNPNPYTTEASVRDLLREKYSSDDQLIDHYLDSKSSLLGGRSPRRYVKDAPKLHASIGFTIEDAWRDIAGLIIKQYG